MPILPDSNVVVNYFKQWPGEVKILKPAIINNELYLSPIVVAEVLSKATPLEQEQLKDLIKASHVSEVNLEVGEIAGKYRSQFSRKTSKVYLVDCLLAATCKVHNLTMATNNAKDYPMKDIKILNPALQITGSLTSKKKHFSKKPT